MGYIIDVGTKDFIELVWLRYFLTIPEKLLGIYLNKASSLLSPTATFMVLIKYNIK